MIEHPADYFSIALSSHVYELSLAMCAYKLQTLKKNSEENVRAGLYGDLLGN
jgi:hypothetical protein